MPDTQPHNSAAVERRQRIVIIQQNSGQLRGMVIILRGLVRDALRVMVAHQRQSFVSKHLHRARILLSQLDASAPHHKTVLSLRSNLQLAHTLDTPTNPARDLIRSAVGCADELVKLISAEATTGEATTDEALS